MTDFYIFLWLVKGCDACIWSQTTCPPVHPPIWANQQQVVWRNVDKVKRGNLNGSHLPCVEDSYQTLNGPAQRPVHTVHTFYFETGSTFKGISFISSLQSASFTVSTRRTKKETALPGGERLLILTLSLSSLMNDLVRPLIHLHPLSLHSHSSRVLRE